MKREITIPMLLVCMLLIGSAVSSNCGGGCISSSYEQQIALLQDNHDLYLDKVYGAWEGKLIGLIAGQPTEGWAKPDIEARAREVGAYPVRYFFPSDFNSPMKGFLRGNFTASPPNDDSDLMLISLLALRDYGINLSSRDIAEAWVKYGTNACTAEAVALENFRKGIWPPKSAVTDNPYQEWIGAQMRIDIWGMIAPGMPEKAAEYAETDARISHSGNGVYAARFIAAAVSLAMVEHDPKNIIQKALNVIPGDCQYANAIKDVIRWHAQNSNWEDTWKLIDDKYGKFSDGSRSRRFTEEKYNTGLYRNWEDMRWVYADVNGAIVTLALLYGKGDFTDSASIAVMSGFDNDCNAGTVAAIIGAMHGERAIPTRWKAPLHDTYITGLKLPNNQLRISDLARETAAYGLQVMSHRCRPINNYGSPGLSCTRL